jgi:hydrogenase maturation protease
VNEKLVADIANAVLYEGYMLYPYRPSSVKNRQRWNFGVVYPKAYSELQSGADNWFMQTECLATGSSSLRLRIKVRFLQAIAKTVGELKTPLKEWIGNSRNECEQDFHVVETLQIGDQTLQTWQEAIEREIVVPPFGPGATDGASRSVAQFFQAERELEPVRAPNGLFSAVIVRTKGAIGVQVESAIERLQDELFKITVRVSNVTDTSGSTSVSRDEALMHSLLSAHTILGISGGEFVSLLDPPDSLKDAVSACKNVGTWPVLAGEEGQRDGILSSPIILYDYPQIAPESPGNLFDGTEIDEILALRILTLTEDEKSEMRSADDRGRQILERTEALPPEHFMKLHGVLRGLRPAGDEEQP